jgi:thiol-disulfide isomerase/thioredoxin
MSPGLIAVLAVLVLGTGIGLWRRRVDGRFHSSGVVTASATPSSGDSAADGTLPIAGVGPVAAETGPEVLDRELLAALGVGPAQATLLQFSSAFCAPCRALRRVSSEVAAMVSGVQHIEVDAESHLEAVRALGIWRTPTLLVLDAEGRVAKRATGVPGKAQLIAVLGEVLPG